MLTDRHRGQRREISLEMIVWGGERREGTGSERGAEGERKKGKEMREVCWDAA